MLQTIINIFILCECFIFFLLLIEIVSKFKYRPFRWLVDFVLSPKTKFLEIVSFLKCIRLATKISLNFGLKYKYFLNPVLLKSLANKNISNISVRKNRIFLHYSPIELKCKFVIKISDEVDPETGHNLIALFHYNSNGKTYEKYGVKICVDLSKEINYEDVVRKYKENLKSKFILDFRELIGDIQDNDFPFSTHGSNICDNLELYSYIYILNETKLDPETIDVLKNRVLTVFPKGWTLAYYEDVKIKSGIKVTALGFSIVV